MTIDAVDATALRKQIREDHVSAKMRGRYNDRNHGRAKDVLPNFERASDAANPGRTIERGTNLK
jgi:hypothetical protein